MLDSGAAAGWGRTECSVRVNSVDSGLCEADLACLLGGTHLPAAVHLPKVGGETELEAVWDWASRAVGQLHTPLGLLLFIETARSLLDIDRICGKARQLAARPGSPLSPVALVFGSDDFAADIGATRTKENTELLLAR